MYSITQHMYPYSMPSQGLSAPVATGPSRQYANHSNSSAFSSSANPDEDWTKISDLAERRRIQNRIAQRNYRKKLKRRLEDLERRAGTTDIPIPTKLGGRATGPNGKPAKSKKQQHTLSSLSAAAAAQQAQAHAHAQAVQAQRQPVHDDDLLRPRTQGHGNQHRRSHSPAFAASPAYSTYPPPEDSSASASSSTSSAPAPAPAPSRADYRDYRGYDYNDWTMAAAAPVTLPSMNHFTDGLALKRESLDSMASMDSIGSIGSIASVGSLESLESMDTLDSMGDDAVTMAPYMSAYSFLSTSIDAVPYGAHPHTPPLSSAYDHSTSCSDAGYEYPTTPLSMASPMRA